MIDQEKSFELAKVGSQIKHFRQQLRRLAEEEHDSALSDPEFESWLAELTEEAVKNLRHGKRCGAGATGGSQKAVENADSHDLRAVWVDSPGRHGKVAGAARGQG